MSTSAAPVEFQQVNVKLPSSQNLDFIHSTSAYKLNTNRWLEEITKNSEVVAKTFEEQIKSAAEQKREPERRFMRYS